MGEGSGTPGCGHSHAKHTYVHTLTLHFCQAWYAPRPHSSAELEPQQPTALGSCLMSLAICLHSCSNCGVGGAKPVWMIAARAGRKRPSHTATHAS